jgi:transposase
MSMHPQEISPVPEETARVARAANPKGNVYMRMRDELGSIYEDQMFTALFPRRGQPAEAPWRLALVTVMQYMEGLSDRQAAEAVRERIDWKYALSLELTDPGFDFSVLTEFRTRLLTGGAETHLLQALLELCKSRGWLKARGRQRTDSTHVLAAIRDLNRLECAGETLRHTLNVLAEVAPDWLLAQIDVGWFDRYSHRFDEYRFPKAQTERIAFAQTIGIDGHRLLSAVYAPTAPVWLAELPAVETLRRVWVQQYFVEEGHCHWRGNEQIPPPSLIIASPYDLDARLGVKRNHGWIGYKVHLTETRDDDAPHLIVHTETTAATTPDWGMAEPIHTALATQDCLPSMHVVDGGYVDADAIVTSRTKHEVEVFGPVPLENSWQAKAADAFDLSHFQIDWQSQRVTCPTGQQSYSWTLAKNRSGQEVIYAKFAAATCQLCPSREQCTHGRSRGLTFRPQSLYLALQSARERQCTEAFKETYAIRAGIESTISQAVRVSDLRQARYLGLPKTHLQHVITATAINVRRIVSWLIEPSLRPTQVSRFAALALQHSKPAA